MLKNTQKLKEVRSHLIAIPHYSRLKFISKCLNLSNNKILDSLFSFYSKKKDRYFLNYSKEWFQFSSINDIILPYKVVEEIVKRKNHRGGGGGEGKNYKIQLVDYHNLSLDSSSSETSTTTSTTATAPITNKIPVLALLGHFNHGKTTLLDSFAGTKLVSEEVHGITQVTFSLLLFLL